MESPLGSPSPIVILEMQRLHSNIINIDRITDQIINVISPLVNAPREISLLNKYDVLLSEYIYWYPRLISGIKEVIIYYSLPPVYRSRMEKANDIMKKVFRILRRIGRSLNLDLHPSLLIL